MPGTRRRRHARALAAVAAITLAGGACGTAGSTPPAASPDTVSRANQGMVESADRPQPGGKLVYGLYGETNGWNPATNQWAPPGLQVTKAIFDTLTSYDESSQARPNVAESLEPDAGFTSWTMKLRPGITLHNGKPVTADVVVRNQTFLAKSPVVGSAYAFAGITGFTEVDELTLRITTSRPSTVLPALFATQLGVVADPDWLESNDSLHPIGTGPFILDTWEVGGHLLAKRNPSYWQHDAAGNALPYLDSIEFRVITDLNSRGAALQASDIDVMESTSGMQVQSFQQLAEFQVYSDAKGESRERMVMLNTQREPFDDVDVRRALAYATDREAFTAATTGGFEEVADGPFAPTSPWYAKTDEPAYDQTKATELVDQIKARHGGKLAFTLAVVANGTEQEAAQVLQQQWSAVGIEVTIDVRDQAKHIINVVTGGYQATMFAQFDTPDPLADGIWWDPDGAVPPPAFSLNFARNKDPLIGEALDRSQASTDRSVQKEQMAVIQRQLAKDLPYVWLTHQRVALIASSRVVNLVRGNLPDGTRALDLNQGAHPLAQIWLRQH